MIPPFGPDGHLPVGAHPADPSEVERRMVDVFAGSTTRPTLYGGWRRRRAAIARLVAVEREWVNGSFVTLKRDPGDVDVVTYVRGDLIEAMSEDRADELRELFDLNRSKRMYGCDGYLVIVRPPGHPYRAAYEGRLAYWDHQWSHERDGSAKGYLDVVGEP